MPIPVNSTLQVDIFLGSPVLDFYFEWIHYLKVYDCVWFFLAQVELFYMMLLRYSNITDHDENNLRRNLKYPAFKSNFSFFKNLFLDFQNFFFVGHLERIYWILRFLFVTKPWSSLFSNSSFWNSNSAWK